MIHVISTDSNPVKIFKKQINIICTNDSNFNTTLLGKWKFRDKPQKLNIIQYHLQNFSRPLDNSLFSVNWKETENNVKLFSKKAPFLTAELYKKVWHG